MDFTNLKCKSKEELLIDFKQKKKSIFIGNEKNELRKYILKNREVEVKEILKKADRFLSGEFIFDMRWDMEKCSIPYRFQEDIDWCKNPFGDLEWTYMLNRHKHIVLYGQAYFLTKNKRYFNRIKRELLNWIETVRPETHKEAWRTIEVGIRLKNWAKMLELIIENEDFEDDFLEKIILSMEEQIKFIIKKSKKDRILSNWVIMENVGVFIATSFLWNDSEGESYINFSKEFIKKALDIQILKDGLHWEQSFLYHNEVLNCISDMLIVAKNRGIEVESEIIEKFKKMIYATLNTSDPNLKQINYGDSDIEKLDDILSVGAVLLRDENLKYTIKEMPIEAVFSVGYKGIKYFENLENNYKRLKSIAFEDSGNYIIRDYDKDKEIFTFFKCGPLGSGHGHYDLLHFTINYKGEDILIDAGRYTYRENESLRKKLKGAKAHNTITVDNEEYNISKGSWESRKIADYVKREHCFEAIGSFVEGAYFAYEGMFLNRKIIYLEKGIWILSDEFTGGENRMLESRFNFCKPRVKVEEKRVIYQMDSGENFNLIPLSNQKIYKEDIEISPEYNSLYKSEQIILRKKGHGNEYLNSILFSDEAGIIKIEEVEVLNWEKRVLDSKFVKGIKITKKDLVYIVVIVTKEEDRGRRTYTVDGTQIYGRVTVIKRKEEQEWIKVLNY